MKRKKNWLMVSMLVIAGFLMIGMNAGAKEPEVIKLDCATYFPATHKVCQSYHKFLDMIQERSNGRIKITKYAGGSLLGAKEVYDGIVDGTADIGMGMIGYTVGRFPIMEMMEMPLGWPSAWVNTHTMNDFYNEYKPKEWNETHPLYFFASPPSSLVLSKPVHTLEELKGVKARAGGRSTNILKALGATPMTTTADEMYTYTSRGVMHGAMRPIEILKGWKMAEVAKHVTNCWQVGPIYTFYVVVNKQTWDSLPKDLKDVFAKATEEAIGDVGRVYNDIDLEGAEYGKEMGVEFIDLAPDEAARWIAAVGPVVDDQVHDLVGSGFSESDIRGKIEFLKKRINYWTEKQKEAGILSATGKF